MLHAALLALTRMLIVQPPEQFVLLREQLKGWRARFAEHPRVIENVELAIDGTEVAAAALRAADAIHRGDAKAAVLALAPIDALADAMNARGVPAFSLTAESARRRQAELRERAERIMPMAPLLERLQVTATIFVPSKGWRALVGARVVSPKDRPLGDRELIVDRVQRGSVSFLWRDITFERAIERP